MLKWSVFYKNFNGEPKERELYFHMSKTEIVRMLANDEIDLDLLQKAADEKNVKELFKFLLVIASKSYGVKSFDGENFVKNATILENFETSAVYDAFVMDIANNEEKALAFFKGVLPDDLLKDISQSIENKAEKPGNQIVSLPDPASIEQDNLKKQSISISMNDYEYLMSHLRGSSGVDSNAVNS